MGKEGERETIYRFKKGRDLQGTEAERKCRGKMWEKGGKGKDIQIKREEFAAGTKCGGK